MENFPIYLNGTFTETDEVLPVHNPYNGELVARTWLAGSGHLEKAIEGALAAREEMQAMPSYKRYEILSFTSAEIMRERERLAGILSSESGKPIRYSLGEIDRAAQVFRVAAEEAKRLPREYLSLDWTPSGHGKEGLVKYFPVGLIAGIAPFNFPVNLAVHKIAPAIAAGNVMILKPARSTPLSVLALAQIMDQTELPGGALSILPMDRVAGNLLVTDPRVQMLSFTGSPEVGWEMKKNAGKKKVLLELGGNAGVIVTESADTVLAANKCLVGGYAYSGQVCIHVQRIFVQEKIFGQFCERFTGGVKDLRYGDPLSPDTDISVMIDEENAIRVEEWVNEAVSGGARILAGGKRRGAYYEPTVITGTRPEMKVCSLEIFGPVVNIERYSSFEQALEMINDSRYGLQAGVFTSLRKEETTAFEKLDVGGVVMNDVPTFRVDHMPYGGVKDSGFGREGVKYSIREMMEPKLLVREL